MSCCHVAVRAPIGLRPNPETAASNVFQGSVGAGDEAMHEYAALVASLREHGVKVTELPPHDSPDACFPNNWFSVEEESVVLYPMLSPLRRAERLEGSELWPLFDKWETNDFSGMEEASMYLEGTGSLVLDRVNRIAYACISERTHPSALAIWASVMQYRVVSFSASYRGVPVYHTNVLMAIGKEEAILWREGISDAASVMDSLLGTGHRVIEISTDEMANFAGNALELSGHERAWWMSQRALDSLRPETRAQFRQPIHSVAIPTIENIGGGSLRCMMAEVV